MQNRTIYVPVDAKGTIKGEPAFTRAKAIELFDCQYPAGWSILKTQGWKMKKMSLIDLIDATTAPMQLKTEIIKQSGVMKSVTLKPECTGMSMLVMTNGQQSTGFPMDEETLKLMHEVITKYFQQKGMQKP